MKNYIVLLTALTGVLVAAAFLFSTSAYGEMLDSVTWSLLFYFVFITLIFHIGLVKTSKGRPQVFIRYYMASTTFKLLLHMGIIIIYALFNKEDAIRFIISFLIYYLIFTAFEVAVAWKQFRKN